VLVYEYLAELPVVALRKTTPLPIADELAESLALVSLADSEFHDGFHLVSTDWKLTHVAQYFSPPILPAPQVRQPFGGRYMAALFGSALPGVVLTGIVSSNGGLAIFKHGKEVHFEWVSC
jgi:DNA integrity scanning protein DisA with diadenylate cyclase activity